MPDRPVSMTRSGPPETTIDAEPPESLEALAAAAREPLASRRSAVAAVVARFPRVLAGWADLGDLGRDEVEAYAAYRVGYHRGLDRLRANDWRGSGYVRWEKESNQGFLRCLNGLALAAGRIGEVDEQQRCSQFLTQLDPNWPPTELPT